MLHTNRRSTAPFPRRSRAVLVLVLALAATYSFAQSTEYSVIRTIFLPSVFYVGDRVELRITIRTAVPVDLTPPETLPEASWADFHSVRVDRREDGWDVRVAFSAFEPGTHTVPEVDLGGIRLSGVDIHVRSILGDRVGEPAPPQPQLLLPSTRLMFGIAGGVIVFVPLAWFTFIRWGRTKINQLIEWYRRRRPYRRLAKALRGLRMSAESADGRSFYRNLMEEMRKYLSQKLGRDCMSATTSELEEYLIPVVKTPESRREIVGVFRAGDLVKFAGRTSNLEERQNHVDILERAAAEIESEDRRRAHVGR